MADSNFSPFSENGLRRRLASKKDYNAMHGRGIAIDTSSLDCLEARVTQSAVTPHHYKRSALLALAQSPLAATCIDHLRLAKFTSLLSANYSPSSTELGINIKGSPSTSISAHLFSKDRSSNLGESPSTAMTTARWCNNYKPTSCSTIQFNRESYAARHSIPFTPDPSLMKPVDLSAWTPSITTPMVTPNHNADDHEILNKADSDYASLNCNRSEKQQKKDTFTADLRPSAKVFIPSSAPLLMSNPQPKRLIASDMPPNQCNIPTRYAEAGKAPIRESASVRSHASSLGTHLVSFEVPKALTPLARPSTALPARPAACAVEPNLPRWAHSPGHAMIASLDSRHKPFGDFNDKASLIRPVCTIKMEEEDSRVTRGSVAMKMNHAEITPRDLCESADEDEALMSCVSQRSQSGSMTPWAKQKSRGIPASTMDHDKLAKDMGPWNTECAIGMESPQITKISFGEKQSPERHASVIMSARMPAGAVAVGDGEEVKAAASLDGNTWRRQIQRSWVPPREPRKPNRTPSVPGGLLGAVPMHSVNIK